MSRSEDQPPPKAPPHTSFAALKASLAGSLPAGPEPAREQLPPAPAKRSTGRVTVRRERSGRGGKCVTLAEGPGLAGRDLPELAREAARALGTGARVEGGSLVVQGDLADRLAAWLGARGFDSVARGN